jgi:hypothetical protein
MLLPRFARKPSFPLSLSKLALPLLKLSSQKDYPLQRWAIPPLQILRLTMRYDSDDPKNPLRETIENSIDQTIPVTITDREMMTLIPWKDVWMSLKIASTRGNGEMVAVFYDTLFKEAVFDDHGAWAWDLHKRA